MKNFLLFILLILGQSCGAKKGTDKVIYLLSGDKKVEINTGTFAITYIGSKGARCNISTALENEAISKLEYNTTKASWKDSKNYIGGYCSNNGGIPSRYAMQVPLKDKYIF